MCSDAHWRNLIDRAPQRHLFSHEPPAGISLCRNELRPEKILVQAVLRNNDFARTQLNFCSCEGFLIY